MASTKAPERDLGVQPDHDGSGPPLLGKGDDDEVQLRLNLLHGAQLEKMPQRERKEAEVEREMNLVAHGQKPGPGDLGTRDVQQAPEHVLVPATGNRTGAEGELRRAKAAGVYCLSCWRS